MLVLLPGLAATSLVVVAGWTSAVISSTTPTRRSCALALRAQPRTSWTLLGRALRIHPATAARRWKRLRGSGWAWVTACPGLRSGAVAGAFLELACDPGSRDRIAEVAVLDPRVVSVERTGGGDLLLTLVAADVPALSALVLDGVDHLGGVAAVACTS